MARRAQGFNLHARRSVGNVPLAAVLCNVGISFGSVIVLPILNIYRKYYGGKMSLLLLATFYVAMAVAGLIVEFVFGVLGLVPEERNAKVVAVSISLNYATVLNIIFIVLAAVLVLRFLRTGGPAMLKEMGYVHTGKEVRRR
jgi:uncharacterized protein